MKGDFIMNKYTMYAGTASAMQTAEVKEEKKASLWERFKNYMIENVDIIAPGIIMMNGGYYVPTKK